MLNYRSAEEEARLLERELREGYGTQVLLCRADVADDEEVRGMAEAGRRASAPWMCWSATPASPPSGCLPISRRRNGKG